MALTTASWTIPTTESVTRRQILERILREGFGQYGTLTGGSTSTLVDTTRLSGGIPDNWFKGYIARISRDAGGSGAAPEGEMRFVTASVASTGTVTAGTPVFTAATASGDYYQLWQYIHPQVVLDILDQVMTEDVALPCWSILTEVPDGDMEQNNTTDWGSFNATLTKVSSEPAMNGARWLKIAATSAGGLASAVAVINVVPGKRYHYSVNARSADELSPLRIWVYDEINDTNLVDVSATPTSTSRVWGEFTAPSNAKYITLYLESTTNGASCYFDDVCFFSTDAYDIALPWWVKNKAQVKGIFKPQFSAIGDNLWDPEPRLDAELDRWNFKDDAFGRGQLRIVSRYGVIDRPVYIFGTRPETAWSNENTETKHIDRDWVHARMCYLLYQQMMAPRSVGQANMDWVKERVAFWEKEWNRQRRMQDERLEEAMQAAVVDVYINTNPDIYPERLVN